MPQRVMDDAARTQVANYARQSQAAWRKIVQRLMLEELEPEPKVALRMTDD